MDKLISIVIPVYNAEKYINDTIQSCLNQSYKKIEIVIVNDGSVDKSENIILSYSDTRIKYFKIENCGSCEARNYGISKSSGQLIQFLDHDDIIDEKKIAAQLEKYSIYGDDHIYSSTMGGIVENKKYLEEGYAIYYKNFKPDEYFYTTFNQFGKYLTTGSWLVPVELIKKTHGWDTKAGLNDDGEYFSRIISASKGIIYSDNSIFYFRRDVLNSLSKQFNSKDVYEKWLYSYQAYVRTFTRYFEKRKANELSWKALSVYYCNSYPHYKDLRAICRKQILSLGYKYPNAHGGKIFKKIAGICGVDKALMIYQLKYHIFKVIK